MDESQDAVGQVAFLARSETRVRLLERLRETGPSTQRELGAHLEASRSTVTRSLSALEERGWIERSAGAYRLTAAGDVVTDEFLSLLESIRTTDELSAFLDWFPYAEFSLDVSHLRDAEMTSAGPPDPYAPARKQTELLERTDRFRGFLPSLDIEGTRVVHEQIMERALEAEIVVSGDAEATIESGEYAELFREQVSTGRLTVSVVEETLPFYLGLADDVVQIGVEDDEGFPRALLETTNESVREWAAAVYERYRDRARTKPVDEF
ncbi:helix-turn-helix transcriptional regulator [Halosimplex amylolyticum]|uniref:helix-turn-helix transcriptional regulator n=1 Tax=Halosimplex amylolyticum TaxID=3396616 RepID=UPI003F56917C